MYQELSKEEKKDVKKLYNITRKGSELNPILNRLILESIICFLFAIIITIAIIFFHFTKWYFISVGLLVTAGLVFLYGQYKIRIKEYNKFLKDGYKNVKNKLTKNE